ncbi:MAG: glycoside hydrolase family 2 protein [Dysgonamonadaceae bacterium]|jgi:beta-galactosidase|nr:glycoside hydrolase family 2 protein [Dysgonamonadaceae bacterium]
MKKLAPLVIFLLSALYASSQINYPNKLRLNDGWEFLREDLGNLWEAVRPIAKPDDPEALPLWTKITLPHTWNAEDAVAPDVNYFQGAGWYRTLLDVQNPYKNGRTLLHFEGAGQKTEVFVYTEKVADHIGGYDEWTADITDAAKYFSENIDSKRFNGKIPLSIRCDNSRDAEMIPSDLSDFTLYGGIYRYLNLVYLPAVSLNNLYINAFVDENLKKAKIEISTDFLLDSFRENIELNIQIFDSKNKKIIDKILNVTILNNTKFFTTEIKNPQLWSPDNPQLYRCEIRTSENNDVWCENFGFRTFEFKPQGAFYLNEKRLLLRGTHRHEDHAGIGAAMTEAQIRAEMQMIKDMGANFIRLGHYQQSRIVLNLCDSLGLLVWEEIPWCRGGVGGEKYKAQAKRMLKNMIGQHRNHPSVVLWGLGNENDWENDFPEFDKQKIRNFMSELNALAHKLDSTRLTSIRRCDFCSDIVDVYSPSIWAGWYSGFYQEYKAKTENWQAEVSRFFHAEWGGDSHAGRFAEHHFVPQYDENGKILIASKSGDWSENYICDLFDWHLKEQETMPNLTGSAFWTFKDFATPLRPDNPVPYINQKGVVERDLTPKETYYVVQSYWTDEPMIHIFGHNWYTRWGKTDEMKTLKVYSNCEKVELLLNGKSLGIKMRNSQDFPAAGLRWETNFLQGKNIVKAIGIKGKTTIIDSLSFTYETHLFGKATKIAAKIIENTNEYAWIETALLDLNGSISLESSDFIYFDAVGDGKLIVNQGTAIGSSKVQAINGKAQIKLLKNSGKTVVSIKADGLQTAFIAVE